MHAKIIKWAWWAFTIAIVQHLILTANAKFDSEKGLDSIDKRSGENKFEERFLEIKKFAFDTGSTPNKRSPIQTSSVVELLTSLKKRAPISWGTGQSNAYFFGPKCTGNVCHRSLSNIGNLATSLVKRSPIFWVPKKTMYFAGASCRYSHCRRDVQMANEEIRLKQRSPLPSNIEDPINSGVESNIASMRSTLDDLAEDMTMILLRKRFNFQFFPNFFRLFPGSHRKRQDFVLDDEFSNMLTKRWGIPWWMSRYFGAGGGTRRQELESDQDLTTMLAKRWGIPWWMNRYFGAGGGTRRQEFDSDEESKGMLTKRYIPWGAKFWTHARKRRDGLDFESEDILHEEKRFNKDDKKMLFTERWIDDVESHDESIEQVKRSPILGPLIMYWTMPMRRTLKDEAQIAKREPFWMNFFAYKPGNHRRSSETEEEREVRLVKRSPIFRGKAPYFSAPPKRRKTEGTETAATSGNIVKKREEHDDKEKVMRELSLEQQVGENVEVNLIKREPIFRWNRNLFAPPRKKRQNEENESNLIKREPIFTPYWKSYIPAPPRKKREIEENANIDKRELIIGKVNKYEFGHQRRQLEESIKREVVESQAEKEEQFNKRVPIFSPKGTGYYGTQKGKITKRSAEIVPIKREVVETQAEKEEQFSRRMPIFSPKGMGYYKTQNGKNTKRNAEAGKSNAIVKRDENEEQLSKRTPIFSPKGMGYMGSQIAKNVK